MNVWLYNLPIPQNFIWENFHGYKVKAPLTGIFCSWPCYVSIKENTYTCMLENFHK